MTIILFIALIVTHILKYGKGSYSEGMTSMDSTTSTNSTDKKTTDEKPVSEDKKVVDNVGKIDESLEKLSKVKDMSDRILDIDKNGIDPEKTKEMADDLTKMKVMKNKIVEQVKGMQPMIENFYGHIEKMKNNTISLQEKVKL
jgi:DNA-directed RNA polymerase subunit F